MSAIPLKMPGSSFVQWNDIADDALREEIAKRARAGMVVLAAEGACFDATIHAVFSPCLVPITELLEAGSAENSRPALKRSRYPLVVLDCGSIELHDIDHLVSILPTTAAIVLLHADDVELDVSLYDSNIVFQLANNGNAGKDWAEFQNERARNNERLVVLDFINLERAAEIEQLLAARNFQVVLANERAATTFVQSPVGSQILLIEAATTHAEVAQYIRRQRMSHESDVLGILVTGELRDETARCELLEAGADDLLGESRSKRELLIKLFALGGQQMRSRQIRLDAYRFPGSVAYNADYLMNVGNKLYASAQRDVITMALAVIRIVFIETDTAVQVSNEERRELVQSIAHYCGKNLRETDLFAQAGEREFIALVTCVGRNNITRVFNRLSNEVGQLVERSSGGNIAVRLDTGVTCDLGVSFTSMLERAQQALEASSQSSERSITIN